MKKCPQCNAEYGGEVVFCLNDGTKLAEVETVIIEREDDDDDTETIIRNRPIIVDFGDGQTVTQTQTEILTTGGVVQEIPDTATSPQVVVIEKEKSNKIMYALLLVVGLLLGGLTALAALYLSRNKAEDNANTTNINISVKGKDQTVSKPTPIEKPSIQQTETTPVGTHTTKAAAPDTDFNGRVITLNAYVRSAPSKNAAQTDVLPMNDRINIGERENPNSPWYKVTCEHGVTGWMHGDTIEFTN